MEVTQNCVQWRTMVLAVFIFLVLLPQVSFVNFYYYNLSFTICMVFPSIPICFISHLLPPSRQLTSGRKMCLRTKLRTACMILKYVVFVAVKIQIVFLFVTLCSLVDGNRLLYNNVQRNPLLESVLSQMNSFHALIPYFFKINFTIILPSTLQSSIYAFLSILSMLYISPISAFLILSSELHFGEEQKL